MTTVESVRGMIEDVRGCETLAELKALEDLGREFEEVKMAAAEIAEMRRRLESVDPNDRLRDLLGQLHDLRSRPLPISPYGGGAAIKRAPRKYKLVREDVGWSTKPQVHAVMAILRTVIKVGEVADEDQIIEAMEKHAEALNTRQPPRRIWDYYKGSSAEGLLEHGNIERI